MLSGWIIDWLGNRTTRDQGHHEHILSSNARLKYAPRSAYVDAMTTTANQTPPSPGREDALATSETQLAAVQTVPAEPVSQRLREGIARTEAAGPEQTVSETR